MSRWVGFAVFLTALKIHPSFTQELTPAMCSSHDPATTWEAAMNSLNSLDGALLGNSGFSRVVHGQLELRGGPQVNPATNGGGTNPFGDYFVTVFPPEILPSDACDLQVPSQINPSPRDKTVICRQNPENFSETISQSFLMGSADAMVIHMCTPPPCRFFSLDSYLSIRYDDENDRVFYPGTNFGDTVNNCNMINPDAIFDSPTFIVVTADGAAAQKVSDALVAQGADPSSVLTHALDSSTLKLYDRNVSSDWAASTPDVLVSLLRVTLADSASERAAYQNQSWPISFYFADDQARGQDPLAPQLVPRATTRSELDLADALQELESAVRARFSSSSSSSSSDFPNASVVGSQTLSYNLTGLYDDWDRLLDELKNNNTYQLATRDAVYGEPLWMEMDPSSGSAPPAYLSFTGAQNGVVLFGVLHQQVLATAFQESGVDVLSLSGAMKDSKWLADQDLEGSALRYLEGTPYEDAAGDLFAIDVMPPGMCTSSSSSSAGTSPWCVELNATTAAGDLLAAAERVYQVTDSCVGPDLSALLPTKALLVDLIGATRDPCEGQFGAFACKLSGSDQDDDDQDRDGISSNRSSSSSARRRGRRNKYELVYEAGCDSACGECSQVIRVSTDPDLQDWATCHTELAGGEGSSGGLPGALFGRVGSAYSMRLECDPDDGSFSYTVWDGVTCVGECAQESGPTSTALCFPLTQPSDGDDDDEGEDGSDGVGRGGDEGQSVRSAREKQKNSVKSAQQEQCLTTLVQPVELCGTPPQACEGRYTSFFCDPDTKEVHLGANCSDACDACEAYFSSEEAPILNEYTTCYAPGDGSSQRMSCSEDGSEFLLETFASDEACQGPCTTTLVNNDPAPATPGVCSFEDDGGDDDAELASACFSKKPSYVAECPQSNQMEHPLSSTPAETLPIRVGKGIVQAGTRLAETTLESYFRRVALS